MDYPIIGELARGLEAARDQIRLSRSARDLILLARKDAHAAKQEASFRPLLDFAIRGERERLEEALDAERRSLMRADAERLARYERAAAAWKTTWRTLEARLNGLPLEDAHGILCSAALQSLPPSP